MLSSQISGHFEKEPVFTKHFVGVYSLDNLPRTLPFRCFLVFNLSKSSEPGSHWLAAVRSSKTLVEIFDPLGTKIEFLRPHLKFITNLRVEFNVNAFQMATTSTCGNYVIMFLTERVLNYDLTFQDVLSELFETDLNINEKLAIEYSL